MASKRNRVVIGIVAVAVIGVVAITFYSTRGRVADEDAAGAIGAAERYRAEQISDEDVILDIPGQEELATAVFEVLTDEQKAELMGRIDEVARRDAVARFAPGGARMEGLTARQIKGFTVALEREAQAELAAGMRVEAGDFARMDRNLLAAKIDSLDTEARQRALERFGGADAYGKMSAEQKANFALALERGAQAELAAGMRIEAGDFGRMGHDMLAAKIDSLDAGARQRSLERFGGADAYGKMSAEQKANFALALDRSAQAELAAGMRIEAGDFGRMGHDMLAAKIDSLDAEARQRALERFGGADAYGKMSAEQKANFALALERGAQAELAAGMRVEAGDFGRMGHDMLAAKIDSLDAEARQRALERFGGADAYGKMSAEQKAYFALALERGAQAELAAGMRVEAGDFGRMGNNMLAVKIDSLDASARQRALERFGGADAYGKMSAEQKANFALALERGAQAELAAGMRVEAGDFAHMRAPLVAEKISALDAGRREAAFSRFEADDAAFERRSMTQRAAFADALGAKACERAILQARAFNNLRQEQQLAVWSNLGRNGQEAALRYAGLSADLARGNASKRQTEFDRFMTTERRTAQEAATR